MGIKSLGNKKSIKYAAVWDETGRGAMKPYDPYAKPLSWCGDRGVWGGGYSLTNTLDYITITTPGNATDFGNLNFPRYNAGSLSSGSRGCWASGVGESDTILNNIEYITIANTGNASNFGELLGAEGRSANAGVSNGTRGCFGGGYKDTYKNIIDYITIANTGNATDFGDLLESRAYIACSSGT